MKKIILIIVSIGLVLLCFSFIDNGTDTCHKSNSIFDYFRQEKDSSVYIIGPVFLMKSDSLSFKEKNEYCTKDVIINGNIVRKEIFFKEKLLYSYTIKNGKINGLGYCFYPFLGKIAVQGNFCNSKLHGIVTVQNKEGKIIEIMKYRRGKYIKHIFHQNFGYKKHKFKSKNPLRYDYVITNY